MECFLKCFKLKEKRKLGLHYKPFVVENEYTPLPIKQEKKIIREELQDTIFYMAKTDYYASSPYELTYRMGDIIEVEGSRGTHLRARLLGDDRIGFINKFNLFPESLYEYKPWFFSNINRIEAENLLLQEQLLGSFLVRTSMTYDYNPFTLSVRGRDENNIPLIRHYKIFKGNFGYFITSTLQTPSLEKLIAIYSDDSANHFGLQDRLRKPCPRPPKYEPYANNYF